MSYKPFKIKREKDIYAKYDRRREQKSKNSQQSNVKIFGFRSGLAYKMIPALLYYAFAAFYIGTGIYGELAYLEFEPVDYILMINKYVFFTIMFYSPLIFLSDFKYRDKLPFFKKREVGSSLIGLIIVFMICYAVIQVDIYAMSDTWKTSLDVYEQEYADELESIANEMETETTSVTETTVAVETGETDGE